LTDDVIVVQTIAWIQSVVIGCNFCPFAAKAMLKKSIRYLVLHDTDKESTLNALKSEMEFLDHKKEIETTLIILPDQFDDFNKYLDLVRSAEDTIARFGYEGVYQVASFHPDYCFAGATPDDPANYTNRSIYPMLHILREESVTDAVDHYPGTEKIPEQNIAFARQKGLNYMQRLLALCIQNKS
jgi:hypothetical protein